MDGEVSFREGRTWRENPETHNTHATQRQQPGLFFPCWVSLKYLIVSTEYVP
jgi:hypothetical protein